jgi:hypothetical protein
MYLGSADLFMDGDLSFPDGRFRTATCDTVSAVAEPVSLNAET